ncbi:FAD-dependent oxidoreductase [Allorhodopirellula solitaria]|uniref:FAD-dependent oxidoreductase n=1 Tax=Allorhodopirellula solitaria TaxID=2527987 RepID=UPI0011B6F373|nr:FAD-dependent oxidoreductase [Allorhodopirellula solitaria]
MNQAVIAGLVAVLTLLSVLDANAVDDTSKPNILFVYVDDLGYEALNSYGGLDFSTPNLDQMAAEGIRFTRAYASGVCTPSRVSMHTGLYASRHQQTGVLPVHRGTKKIVDFQRMPTFAQRLRARGYRTTVTGKWQLGTLEIHPEHPRDSGFDSWCLWQIWKTNPESGRGEKTTRYWNPTFNQDGVIRNDIADSFGPDVLVDYAIDFMRQAQQADEPFLIVHNEMMPHWPVIQTPDDRAATPQREASLSGMVAYLDKLVKRLLDAVDELGIRENTYVVFMADNGTNEPDFANPKVGQPGERAHTRHTKFGNVNGGKFSVTDGGTHVPMIVWGPPAVPVGTICDDLVDVVDLFPTFCELSGAKSSDGLSLDGHSLVPQFHGRPGRSHAYTYGVVDSKEAVFNGQWRLKKTGELVDARNLPAEPIADEADGDARAARSELQDILDEHQSEKTSVTAAHSKPEKSNEAEARADAAEPTIAGDVAADIVVYGDGAGGVTAAVQAARMGKDVVLISDHHGHLGGLTSSGLGWTDIGNRAILGGLSREFYHRVYQHYQDDSAWVQQQRSEFPTRGQGAPTFDSSTQLASVFEPKVAEKVFQDMAAEAGVAILSGRIDQARGIQKHGTTITQLRLEDGRTIQGQMFIDASYEGDLMAAADVSFRMGRESNAEFDETHNGFTSTSHGNQITVRIDPYVIPGDRDSGLIRGVTNSNPNAPKTVAGAGDDRFQAYCYRLCLTDVPQNRITIEKPASYDEADFELVLRAAEAGKSAKYFKTSPIPNRKTDANNASGVSMDYIGMNYGIDEEGEPWNWATLTHRQRDALADRHAYWQLGLIWTIQNHSRVPEDVRRTWSKWGLSKDEFSDNEGVPYNLYVREARRMASPFVMTEAHCRNETPISDSIAMGAYTMDSHNVQRLVDNGSVKNEGDIQKPLRNKGPYPISYRAIVPPHDECTNLLVPWSLSSTHIAFGSIRMEPVFMCLGQAAATAAAQAIDADISVQDVPYDLLRKRLIEDGAQLEVAAADPTEQSATIGLNPDKLSGLVLDDEQAERSGTWTRSTRTGESLGLGYFHDGGLGNGQCSATYTARLPKRGRYEVRLAYTTHDNRATNVPVSIVHLNGTANVQVNQRQKPPIEGLFISLGQFEFSQQSQLTITNRDTDGHVILDGVQWLPVD